MNDYYNKYLKYKKKYINLKKTLIGGSSKETDIDFNTFFDDTVKLNAKENILLNIYKLLLELYHETDDNTTIVCIGDSPSIFLLLFEKLIEGSNKTIHIKYFPISKINAVQGKNNKGFTDKLNRLSRFITNNIIWVDYVSSGNSFITFMENLPESLKEKSKFFIYGSDIIYHHEYKSKIKSNDKVTFHKIEKKSLFYTFVSSIVGNSENYNIRCVKRQEIIKDNKINNSFNATIHDSKVLPMKRWGAYCKEYSQWLFEQLKSIGINNIP
jgi:hypothetical protein